MESSLLQVKHLNMMKSQRLSIYWQRISNAKIATNYEQVPVRYNSYSDEVEFKKNGEVQVLPKNSDFSRIEIASPKQTIVMLETSDELSDTF
jgi:hypothetical protein